MTVEQMRERKKELGYSYEKIAELAGIPLATVQKVLGGITKSPRHETLQALEKVFSDHSETEVRYSYNPSPEQILRIADSSTYAQYHKDKGFYTVEDYYALPDERRVELIDGVFYDMAAPTWTHQLISLQICRRLFDYVEQKGGDCIPVCSPIDVQLDCDNRTMVQPDVLVVCDRSKIRDNRVLYGAPDFIAEVLSVSTRRKDMGLKFSKYINAGVREYWMVDPDQKKLVVYDLEHENPIPTIYGFGDQVPVGIFEGECVIDFTEIEKHVSFLYESEQK